MSIHDAEAELEQAKKDAAQYRRLSGAAARVKKLEALCGDITETDDLKPLLARHREVLPDFEAISVTEPEPGRYVIQYTKQTYDADFEQKFAMLYSVEGFTNLPGEVVAYLVTKHPGEIPDAIMTWAPGKPLLAIRRYQALHRSTTW